MADELEQLLALTQTLHARAEAGEWEAVARLEGRRRARLQSWCQAHAAGIDAGQRRMLEQIHDLNHRLEALARARHDRLGAELHDLRRGRSGAAAYAANRGR